jgi:hypothetical protein
MYDGSAIVLNVPMGARNKSSLTTPTHVVNGRQKKEKEKNRGRNRLTKRTREAASDRTAVVWTWGGQREGEGEVGDEVAKPGVEGRWREEERKRGDGRVEARGPGSRAGPVPLPTACGC